MCGISGFSSFRENYLMQNPNQHLDTLVKMRTKIKHRGFDQTGEFLDKHVGFSHTRLSIRDISGGMQPMKRHFEGHDYIICYNGEIYNTDELNLQKEFPFETSCDTEVILYAYIKYGEDCVKYLNGIFAFAIWDGRKNQLFLARDQLGVKPLFYTVKNNELVFASEIKALFQHKAIEPTLNLDSFREIFALGPARSMDSGVFKNILQLQAGHCLIFSEDGLKIHKYWDIPSYEHKDSYKDTVDKVSFLVTDSIKRQLVSDVGVCSFLSGGLDSSIITAIAAENSENFNTYSFDFKGNDKYFESNAFQPERDNKYVDIMLSHINTNHQNLLCDETKLVDLLETSMISKDLPGMADVDASLLYFCEIVKKENKVALTGECADEIFGGYPWFYREDLLDSSTFPWTTDLSPRSMLLHDDFAKVLDIENYAKTSYENSLKQVPVSDFCDKTEARKREITYLNIKWFMQTLLDRMDRASMHASLEARVPFADPRIIEYVYNVPFSMKRQNNVEKSLLRDAFSSKLPSELINRKKSPYPKTYNTNYDALLRKKLQSILDDKNSPIHYMFDKNKITDFINKPLSHTSPWFGQLMSSPQLVAYIIQINQWILQYSPRIDMLK